MKRSVGTHHVSAGAVRNSKGVISQPSKDLVKTKMASGLCLICKKHPSVMHPQLGILSCLQCRQAQRLRTSQLQLKPVEFIPDSVKKSRKEYADDILQSGRDGVLSKEYVKKYGYKHLNVSPEEVKNMRNTWDDLETNFYKSDSDGQLL